MAKTTDEAKVSNVTAPRAVQDRKRRVKVFEDS